jgi:hypothetical protein
MKYMHISSYRNTDKEATDRFVRHYQEVQAAGSAGLKKVLTMVGGAALLLAGIVLLAFPGPGILLILAGGTMMAQYSLVAAKALDKVETLVRRIIHRVLEIWHGADRGLKTLMVTAALLVAAAPMIAGYHFFF